jgi:hypothetical protein
MAAETLPPWKYAWRCGIQPLLSDDDLRMLAQALEADDPRLLQSETVFPPATPRRRDVAARSACVIGLCGMGRGLTLSVEVDDYFSHVVAEAGVRLNDPAGASEFTRHWDEGDRDEVRRELLEEVRHNLAVRQSRPAPRAAAPAVAQWGGRMALV